MTTEYNHQYIAAGGGYRNGHTVNPGQYRHKTRKGSKSSSQDQGLSNGLIILIIAIVVGCFAVLWPKYFYPMLFGEAQHHPKFDPETMFMEGPHGREYLRNRLKNEGGHPGVHPGTGQGGQVPPPPGHGSGPAGRRTPPIRPAADGPMPGMRPMPGIHPVSGHADSPMQDKGRGAMGYLMPVYTVAIIILFVYTAMKLVFKKRPGDEEDEDDGIIGRRQSRSRHKRVRAATTGVTGGSGVRYDEEYYNNLIQQQQQQQQQQEQEQQQQQQQNQKQQAQEQQIQQQQQQSAGSQIEELEPSSADYVETLKEEEDVQKKDNTQNDGEANVTEPIRKETLKNMPSKTKIECQNSDQDKKDLEILMLQARLEQTEKTLQKLIGQMGALTASLAGAGLHVGHVHDDVHEGDQDDSANDEEYEDENNSNEEEDDLEDDSEDESDENNNSENESD